MNSVIVTTLEAVLHKPSPLYQQYGLYKSYIKNLESYMIHEIKSRGINYDADNNIIEVKREYSSSLFNNVPKFIEYMWAHGYAVKLFIKGKETKQWDDITWQTKHTHYVILPTTRKCDHHDIINGSKMLELMKYYSNIENVLTYILMSPKYVVHENGHKIGYFHIANYKDEKFRNEIFTYLSQISRITYADLGEGKIAITL